MAIKEAKLEELARPIELIRRDFKEFDNSDFDIVRLEGYEHYNMQSVRTAAIKVMHEYEDRIKFFSRNGNMYLVKE